jgi:malonyl-CoA reductase/3-hydroxypropionate dehydrogenase (NADP+)
MVESFSRYLGPNKIQYNAIAPGPVDGDRLSGTGGRPGLFQRRARLILENKRLNAVYAEVIKAVREGRRARHGAEPPGPQHGGHVLSHDMLAPEGLRKLALEFARRATACAPGTNSC